jgi:hypothetical protein
MSEPHNHHFVPQFLLKKFLDDENRLWVYDTDAKTIEARSIKASASILDFYALANNDGRMDCSTLENSFNRKFERPAAPAIEKLQSHHALSGKEAFHFVKFVAAQMCRTPCFFRRIQEQLAPSLQEICRRILRHEPGFRENLARKLFDAGATPKDVEELFASVERGEIEPHQQFVMTQALNQVGTVAQQLSQMKWCFLDVPMGDPDLIIGDHPVTLFDDGPDDGKSRTLGIKNPHIEIAIPLSKRMAAFARWHGPVSYGELLPSSVNTMNLRTLYQAQQFVFASINSSELLDDALKVKGMGPKVHIRRVEIDGRHMIIKEYY